MSEEKTTRDTIARLIGESGVTTGPDDEQEAAPEVDEAEPTADVADASSTALSDEEGTPEPKAAAKPGERPRGPDGKFAPAAAPAAAKPGAPPADAAAAAQAQAAAAKLKAPADWRPAAQAEFDKLPRVVQEEALRLHVETKKTLQDAATHRAAAEGWQKRVAPYEPIFRTAGMDPGQGVEQVLGIYAQLVTGAPAVRHQVAAGLIRQFVGTDEASLRALAAHLEVDPKAAAPAAMRPEQVTELVRKSLEQERTAAQRATETQAIRDFEASNPEFLQNVQNELVTLVKLEQGKGKSITVDLLKQLHQRALRLNEETAAILKQRDDAAAAKKNAAEAAKKAAAASGIKNEPAGPAGQAKANSTKDEVRRQMEKQRAAGAHV